MTVFQFSTWSWLYKNILQKETEEEINSSSESAVLCCAMLCSVCTRTRTLRYVSWVVTAVGFSQDSTISKNSLRHDTKTWLYRSTRPMFIVCTSQKINPTLLLPTNSRRRWPRTDTGCCSQGLPMGQELRWPVHAREGRYGRQGGRGDKLIKFPWTVESTFLAFLTFLTFLGFLNPNCPHNIRRHFHPLSD